MLENKNTDQSAPLFSQMQNLIKAELEGAQLVITFPEFIMLTSVMYTPLYPTFI